MRGGVRDTRRFGVSHADGSARPSAAHGDGVGAREPPCHHGQLTASIAHEVNQPLGATITNAQAALRWLQAKEPDLSEVKQALDQIVRAGNRAADVVASVRRIAKKAPAQGVDVSLNHEIEE